MLTNLVYNKTFGNHSLETFVAHESTEWKYNEFSASASRSILPNTLDLNQYTEPNALGPARSFSQSYTLESYFDANAHVGYRINDRFSVYAKANNIANQDYQKWLNYPVQGIQFLAGITYKFDF